MNIYGQHIRQNDDGRNELYPFDYIEYYEARVKPHSTYINDNGEEMTLYDGLTFSEFLSNHQDGFPDIIKHIIEEPRLNELQVSLEKEGKQVCMFNIIMLSMFLLERQKQKYAFLLKPTIAETLAELKDVKRITFTNGDGSKIESSSKKLISQMMETLEANKSVKEYEIEKIVPWDEVSNKSLSQCYFVHELSSFLSSYFSVSNVLKITW